jgi:serine/threonine-protein kinase
MALAAGTRLGPYEILTALGAGGMGEVYRARDTKLNREVAIKVLLEAVAADPERTARFGREAQVLASLNHPNIGAIYGLEDSSGAPALVMELVEGPTLAQRLEQLSTGNSQRSGLPLDEALAIAKQIADALEAAHDKGIIHRDLKPANVKVMADGTVKVLDFGLAKMIEGSGGSGRPGGSGGAGGLTMSPTLSVQATYAGVILGTAAYMSPEQARGRAVDRRTDVWAFGCVVFEMLAGARPFDGDDVVEMIGAVVQKEPAWDRLPASTPALVRNTLQRCLEKDPKQRIRDVGDVQLALAGAFETASAPVAAALAPARTTVSRMVAFAGAGLLVGALATATAGWLLRPPAPKPQVTRFQIPLPEGLGFTGSSRRLLALSPDGSMLAYVSNVRLFLRPLSGDDIREVPGSSLGVNLTSPVFSPDGKSIAFTYAQDHTLKRIAITGGAPVTICPAEVALGISWDETGILFAQADKGILRVSPNGGSPQVIVAIPRDQQALAPQMLPDGKSVLFSLRKTSESWDKAQIVMQTIATGERKVLIEGGADGRYLPSGHLVYALSGVLLAVPFDARRGEVTGGPVPIIEGIERTGTGALASGQAQFSVSTNGTLAYVPGPVKAVINSGGQGLALFDRQGGIQLLKLASGTYLSPRVSPSGKTIAFEREDDNGEAFIGLYDLAETSATRRLTFGGHDRAPVWSPDGQWIAFQSDREGDAAVFRQRVDGTGTAERLTKPEAGTIHTPQSWSPDGAYLLTTVQKEREFTLTALSLKDRQLAPFGNVHSSQPTEASFSPDGKWVVYQSTEPPRLREVFVQPFPATGAKYGVPAAEESATGIGQPYWNRKGSEIVFNASPTQSFSVTFTSTPAVAFGRAMPFSRRGRTEPNPATGRRGADAMPDGEHVIGVAVAQIVQNSGAPRTPVINVVLNWFDEIRQKVPGR